MDTRSKILSWDEFSRAAAGAPVLVSGHFDPLMAEHAERLGALAAQYGPLHVAIADPPDPVLHASARAELVAALRPVAAVAVCAGPIDHPNWIAEEPSHEELRRKLIELVHARHRVATQG